jgi:hypothetical protein
MTDGLAFNLSIAIAAVCGALAGRIFALEAALGDAAEATGPALLWGPAAGAAGGLVVGAVVALFKRYAPR